LICGCAEPARGKTTPSEAESATKKTDSNQEPNVKGSDARVDVTGGKSVSTAVGGQEQITEVKFSTLEGQ